MATMTAKNKRAEAQERATHWRKVDNTLVALGGSVLIFGATLWAISSIQRNDASAVAKFQQQVSAPVQMLRK